VKLSGYFERIGYDGPVAPTLEVLRDVHRAHACTIAYENLDVIRQIPVDQDIERIYRKIVTHGRGGWCYEMNGLLGWALTEIGFEVTRMCGGVMRAARGDDALGNHLVLKVDLDGPWIADVGLGDGLVEPLPLQQGQFVQHGRQLRFEALSPGEWRFHNRANAMPPSFDFHDRIADEALLARTCAVLQEDPESMFRQNLVCQRMALDGGHMLLGRVLTHHADAAPRRLLESEQELVDVLTGVFGLRVPDLTGLWDAVLARHTALFGDTAVDEIRFGPPPQDGS
jgi:N-hydroxyarylamine O-acetyltransferase